VRRVNPADDVHLVGLWHFDEKQGDYTMDGSPSGAYHFLGYDVLCSRLDHIGRAQRQPALSRAKMLFRTIAQLSRLLGRFQVAESCFQNFAGGVTRQVGELHDCSRHFVIC
jgi:hypothetical protein